MAAQSLLFLVQQATAVEEESPSTRASALLNLSQKLCESDRPAGFASCAKELWTATFALLGDENAKVAHAAAECLGSLGAGIFAEGGISCAATEKSGAARAPGRAQGQAGGRSRGRGRARGRHAEPAPTSLPPLILLEWALPQLVGSDEQAALSSARLRQLLLVALQSFLASLPPSIKPAAAQHVLAASKRLLDSDRTTVEELEGYLALMHSSVKLCTPQHVGTLLPDILDVLLGWALDSSVQPRHWSQMQAIIRSSTTAWHPPAQIVCDLVASVAQDMAACLADSLSTPLSPRFMALSAISSSVAAVMQQYPAAGVALHPEVMRTAFVALLQASQSLCEALNLRWPGAAPLCSGDAPPSASAVSSTSPTTHPAAASSQHPPAAAAAQLQACLQNQAAWAALFQRSVPAHKLAALFEGAVPCSLFKQVLPPDLHPSWAATAPNAPQAALPRPGASTGVGVNEDIDPAVTYFVQRAFDAVARQLAAPSDAASPARGGAAVGPVESLPLWLAVCSQLSLAAQLPVLPAPAAQRLAAAVGLHSDVRAPALSLAAVFVPLLQAVEPFCTPTAQPLTPDCCAAAADDGVRSPPPSHENAPAGTSTVNAGGSPRDGRGPSGGVPWARAVVNGADSVLEPLLLSARPQHEGISRTCAALALNLMCYPDNAPAVSRAVEFLEASLPRSFAPDGPQGGLADPQLQSFRVLFGVNLLHTALKRPTFAPRESVRVADAVVRALAGASHAPPAAATSALRGAEELHGREQPRGARSSGALPRQSSGLLASSPHTFALLELGSAAVAHGCKTRSANAGVSAAAVHHGVQLLAIAARLAAHELAHICDLAGEVNIQAQTAPESERDSNGRQESVHAPPPGGSATAEEQPAPLGGSQGALQASVAAVARACTAAGHLMESCAAHGGGVLVGQLVLNLVDLLLAVRASLPRHASDAGGAAPKASASARLAEAAAQLLCVAAQQPLPSGARLRKLATLVGVIGAGLVDAPSAAALRKVVLQQTHAFSTGPDAAASAGEAVQLAGVQDGPSWCSAGDVCSAIGVQVRQHTHALAKLHAADKRLAVTPAQASLVLEWLLGSGELALKPGKVVLQAPSTIPAADDVSLHDWLALLRQLAAEQGFSATWSAILRHATSAIAAHVVDAKLKTLKGLTAQTLAALDISLRALHGALTPQPSGCFFAPSSHAAARRTSAPPAATPTQPGLERSEAGAAHGVAAQPHQAAARRGAGAPDSEGGRERGGDGVLQLVTSAVLPAWGEFAVICKPACLLQLLTCLERRLHEAHTGTLVAEGAPPSPSAVHFFFVNRSEVEGWYARVCERRLLASARLALHHDAIQLGFTRLQHLVQVIEHHCSAATTPLKPKPGDSARPPAKPPANGKTAGAAASGQEDAALAVPTYKVLLPDKPPGELPGVPRSAPKRPVAAAKAAESAASHSDKANAAVGPPSSPRALKPAPTPTSPGPRAAAGGDAAPLPAQPSPSALRLRMFDSLLQLLHALANALVHIHAAGELLRLQAFCVAACTPLLAMIAHDAAAPSAPVHPAADATLAAGPSQSAALAAPVVDGLADRVFAFIGAAAAHAAGHFESALAAYSTSAAAAAELPVLAAEHRRFCAANVAQCYAALADWKGLQRATVGGGAAAVLLSPQVELRCRTQEHLTWRELSAAVGALQSAQSAAWAGLDDMLRTFAPSGHNTLAESADAESGSLQATVRPEAALEGAFARAQLTLQLHMPAGGPLTALQLEQLHGAIQDLGASVPRFLDALSVVRPPDDASAASELLSSMHLAAALHQMLSSSLPRANAADTPPWLDGAGRRDMCQHLLVASALLEGEACGRGELAALSTLGGAPSPAAALLAEAYAATSNGSYLTAKHVVLHRHIFDAARTLASARAYGAGGGAAPAHPALPHKVSVLHTLLTVGERSMAAALEGGNLGAARALLRDLMQSDLVAPLLVAGKSARANALVQESLLRLQMLKLRYQVTLGAQAGLDARAAVSELLAAPAPPPPPAAKDLSALLPASLFDDDDDAGAAPAAAVLRAPLSGAARPVGSGLSALHLPGAIQHLWQATRPCLAADSPLMLSLQSPEAAAGGRTPAAVAPALSAAVTQLSEWCTHLSGGHRLAADALLPEMRALLRGPVMQGLLTTRFAAQEPGVARWTELLACPAAGSAPSVAALAAATLSAGASQPRAWLQLGDCLSSAVRRQLAARAAALPGAHWPAAKAVSLRDVAAHLTPDDRLCVAHMALCYGRVLQLGESQGAEQMRLMLRLLQLLVQHEAPQVVEAVLAALDMVPPATWEVLAPQLFVHLRHPRPSVRRLACHLLSRLSTRVPAAVIYSLVAEYGGADADAPSSALRGDSEIQELTHRVSDGHPERVPQCRALIASLQKLTPLCAEGWHATVAASLAEIRRRVITLQLEAVRIRQHKEIVAPDELRLLLQRRYCTLLLHATSELELHIQRARAAPPSTPHEAAFQQRFLPRLDALLADLKQAPADPEDEAALSAKWRAVRALLQDIGEALPGPTLDLADVAPALCVVPSDAALPIPGAPQADVVLIGVAQRFLVLPSKTRPKRIDMLGSDGASYRFLLKGGEDLRQEQRVQQLLSCVNSCIQSYTHAPHPPASDSSLRSNASPVDQPPGERPALPEALHAAEGGAASGSGNGALPHPAGVDGLSRAVVAGSRDARVETLNVTPLGRSMGLVQWVPASVTLYDSFKAWQLRTLARYAAVDRAGAPKQAAPPPDGAENAAAQEAAAALAAAAALRAAEACRIAAGVAEKAGRGRRGGGRGGGRTPGRSADARDSARGGAGQTVAAPADDQALKTEPLAAEASTSAPGDALAAGSKAPAVVRLKPVDLFYQTLQQCLKAAGLPAQSHRQSWPPAVLLQVFLQLSRQAPAALLAKELQAAAPDSRSWWRTLCSYTHSLASSSVAGYLFGVGDRHLNNILLLHASGKVVHVDMSVCFEQGHSLRVAEVVPFRLTQMLVHALGPMGAQGSFASHAQVVLEAARQHSAAIQGLLDTVLLDPQVDWLEQRRRAAASKGLDAAMALQLWLTHLQEVLPPRLERLRAVLAPHLAPTMMMLQALHDIGALLTRHRTSAKLLEKYTTAIADAATQQAALAAAQAEAQTELEQHLARFRTASDHVGAALPTLRSAVSEQAALWHRLALDSRGEAPPPAGSEDDLPSALAVADTRWLCDRAPTPLTLFAPQPGLVRTHEQQPTSLQSAVGVRNGNAWRAAMQTMAPAVRLACEQVDDLFPSTWLSHTSCCRDLAQAVALYARHVPRLAAGQYLATSHHHAWLATFEALRAAALDVDAIASAARHVPQRSTAPAHAALALLAALVHHVDGVQAYPPASTCHTAQPRADGPLHEATEPSPLTPTGNLDVAAVVAAARGSSAALRSGVVAALAEMAAATRRLCADVDECAAQMLRDAGWTDNALTASTRGAGIWSHPSSAATPGWPHADATQTPSQQPSWAWAGGDSIWKSDAPLRWADVGQANAPQPPPADAAPAGAASGQALRRGLPRLLASVSRLAGGLAEHDGALRMLGAAAIRSALLGVEPRVQALQDLAADADRLAASAAAIEDAEALVRALLCRALAITAVADSAAPAAGEAVGLQALRHVADAVARTVGELQPQLAAAVSAHEHLLEQDALLRSYDSELAQLQSELEQLQGDAMGGSAPLGELQAILGRRHALLRRRQALSTAWLTREQSRATWRQQCQAASSAVLRAVEAFEAALQPARLGGGATAAPPPAAADAAAAGDAADAAERHAASQRAVSVVMEALSIPICASYSQLAAAFGGVAAQFAAGLHIPAAWRASGTSGADAPFEADAGAPLFGAFGSSTGAVSIWGATAPAAELSAAGGSTVPVPPELQGAWGQLASLFALDRLLRAAVLCCERHTAPAMPPAAVASAAPASERVSRGRGRGRGRCGAQTVPSPEKPSSQSDATNVRGDQHDAFEAAVEAAQRRLAQELSDRVAEAVAAGPALAAARLLDDFCSAFAASSAPPSEPTWLPTASAATAAGADAAFGWKQAIPGSGGIWGGDPAVDAPKPPRAWEPAHFRPRSPPPPSRMVPLSSKSPRKGDAPAAAQPASDDAGGPVSVDGSAQAAEIARGLENQESEAREAHAAGQQLVAFDAFDADAPGFDMLLEDGDAGDDGEAADSEADGAVDESWLFQELEGLEGSTPGVGSQALQDSVRAGAGAAAVTAAAEEGGEDASSVAQLLLAHLRRAVPGWRADAGAAGGDVLEATVAAAAEPTALRCREACRLCQSELRRLLALFLWMHEHLLDADLAAGCWPLLTREHADAALDGATEGATLATALAALQGAARTLFESQQGVRRWVDAYHTASTRLAQQCFSHFQGLGQAVQMYAQQAEEWSASALAYSSSLLEAAGGVLALEFSRRGVLWRPEAPAAPAFGAFPVLLADLCASASSARAAQLRVRRAGDEAATLHRDAAHANHAISGCRGEAAEAQAAFYAQAPRVLQLVASFRGSLQALGDALPPQLAALNADVAQLADDIGALAKAHASCADVAVLCAQLSQAWGVWHGPVGDAAAAMERVASAIRAAQGDLLQPPPNVPPAVAAAERLLEVSVADAAAALAAASRLGGGEAAAPAPGGVASAGASVDVLLGRLALVQQAVESVRLGAAGVATSLQAEASASRHSDAADADRSEMPKLDANRKAFAKSVIRRTAAKLRGQLNGSARQHTSAEQHVKLLIAAATSPKRLSRMYEGWTPWL